MTTKPSTLSKTKPPRQQGHPAATANDDHPPENVTLVPAPMPPFKKGFYRDAEGNEHQFPEWAKAFALTELPHTEPDQIIEGILYLGGKLGVTAGSKSMKTWFLLYVAYCIANGLKLFDRFQCKKLKVAYLDLELLRYTIRKRLERIQAALKAGNFDNIRIIPCRGHAREVLRDLSMLEEFLHQGDYKVVVLDPMYKTLIGKDENFSGDVADILDRLTQIAQRLNISFIYAHHHSKGNQRGKEAIDRGSGAGAWGRDPDAALDLADHDQPNCFTASLNLRDFAPIDPFVVRFEFPIMVEAKGLDPNDLKKPANAKGRPKNENEEAIVVAIKALEVAQGAATIKQIVEITQIAKRTVHDRISKKLLPADRILKSPLGYQVSVKERLKMRNFFLEQFPRDKEPENNGETDEN